MAGTVLLKVCRAVVVMTVVVIGAVGASSGASATALHGRGRAVIRTHKFGRETSDAQDAGLISRLAVLRRPQTEADVLPAGVTVMGAHGVIIPTLTRLVAQPAGASVYLAVSTPLAGSPPLWSPKLGDQVGIVTVTTTGATETFTAPAADLTNAFIVEGVEGAPVASSQAPTSVYEAGIVPDGVARVRWTFANATAKRTYVVDVPASNDVAITPFHAGTPFLLRATWYAPDGSVVPTSDSALRHAMAARGKVLAQRIGRQDERSAFRPPPGILADFAVFGVTSRSGIRVGDLTISHPRLSSVPLPILQLTRPRARMQLDPSDMREATTRNGVSVWIVPGRKGLCAAAVDPSSYSFPFRYDSGAGAGCSGSIAQAELYGAGVGICCSAGYSSHYGVLPDAHPTRTIRTGPHTHMSIRPPDGVYIYRTRQ